MPPGKRGFRRRQQINSDEGTFDPEDTQKVKHTRIGIWDLYEEVTNFLETLLCTRARVPHDHCFPSDRAQVEACSRVLAIPVGDISRNERELSIRPANVQRNRIHKSMLVASCWVKYSH
jgi:hypothetical protein